MPDNFKGTVSQNIDSVTAPDRRAAGPGIGSKASTSISEILSA